ncbi:pyridoxal 5'-phosphate synthase glutaminase subunit PdxT [Enemella evansiae]|uniref:Pyridoxal 5'-phosphate synthase subunit PdxT n=1 Tax=Enemella evansiae TaxID=2016499 RepID=A0A255GP73_9ACTN|nr:pyridoxal 5'-phosphate synthase glutaminase subunit PdxT [Enemella evansiae]OYO11934.1 pyridoxal 5'-phosphate synthase glutaminase subunit PdxT [Enemella evansiae]OYO17615.1 pyridoxal 5'-phosphate synthase glutaminase subunit PdxT [Enemella evansiae]
MRIGVLALQGAVSEHGDRLASLGVEVALVRRPAQLADLDGLVLPGGESTTMARLCAQVDLVPALRERIADGLPVLGTCAGLVMLADEVRDGAALQGFDRIGGLPVSVRRNGFGGQLASAELPLHWADGGAGSGVFIRAPRIEEVGPEVEVLARWGDEAVAVRRDRILAASFHPELSSDTRLHELLCELAAESMDRLAG